MTRFAKLTLLLIVAGALALAGCGGDDNGLSAEDMARLSAADEAKMTADEAKMTADEAKTAADAAQAEAEQAKQDAADALAAAGEDLTPEQAVMATWEALFTPAVETRFTSMVGTNPTIASIAAAIATIADMYDVTIPGGNRATLDAMLIVHFSTADPTPSTALAYFQMLRSGGFLPATQQRALMVLTSNTTSHQWEATFAPSVEEMFSGMVGDDPTQEKIRMEIQNIARAYGVVPPSTAALQASIQNYFEDNPREGTALGFFRMYRADYNFLPATADRVADVIADRTPSGTTTADDMDDMDDMDDDTSMMTTAEKIDALLDSAATHEGLAAGAFIEGVSFSGATSMHGKVSHQAGQATVVGGRYEGQFGYWLDESFLVGVLKDYNDVLLTPFTVGMSAGSNPTGSGEATWTGAMVGYWDADGIATDAISPVSARANASLTIEDLFTANNVANFTLGPVTVGSGTAPIVPETLSAATGDWHEIAISGGMLGAAQSGDTDYIHGRFLTGHSAVVGSLQETISSGTLIGSFGAVK